MSALHHKLVRFDCQISDMYAEEYFVGVFNGTKEGQPALIYKYFTELSPDHLAAYDTQTGPDAGAACDRGNMLATSIANMSKWMKNGSPDVPKQCIIKLYDESIKSSAFKLNDIVTIVGILEFNKQ